MKCALGIPVWMAMVSLAVSPVSASDSVALSRTIDERLAQSHQENLVVPAPAADDVEFLRRASLDLIGRIPKADEVVAFLDDPNPSKRARVIDEFLHSDEHAGHFARTWRGLLLSEAETERQLQYLVPGFEEWLRQRRNENAGFDEMVRELLAVPITGTAEKPQMVLTDLQAANPIAFVAAKEADPAKLAAATTRIFLGVRLECAECHDHPFEQWSQMQFWNQAAFFAGVQRRGRGAFSPLYEDVDRRTVSFMNEMQTASVAFLDGEQPRLTEGQSARVAFADWITSPENPYFATAIANRIWGQLMGTGLVTPVDDMHASNAPSHPELLSDISSSFAASGHDVSFLYRAICNSEAYQRSSRITHESQTERSHFARMPVKPMTGEQFFDSLAQAVGSQLPEDNRPVSRVQDATRRKYLDLFPQQEIGDDPVTSVAQALALMNSNFVNQAVTPETSGTLRRLLDDSSLTMSDRINRLYLTTFSRFPNDAERAELLSYVTGPEESEWSQQLGDIFWVLLNSAEFRWNR